MKSKILFALLGLLCCTIVSDATAQPLEKKGHKNIYLRS